MFDPITITAIAVAAAGGYSAYQSKQQADMAKKQSKDQERAQTKLAAGEEQERAQTAMRSQRRRGAVGEPGLRDTILTGGLGTIGTPSAQPKTLLGM